MKRVRFDWLVVVTAILSAFGCGGGGCGGCAGIEPIPGGYPSAERHANAAQLRVTHSALAKIAADPAALIGGLAGGANSGVVTFPVPASCSGTAHLCCPGGVANNNCGP